MGFTPDGIDQQIGRRVREFREQRGLSPAELGRLAGISADEIEKCERGNLDAAKVFALASALKTHVASFFRGPGEDEIDGSANSRPLVTSESLRLMRAFYRITSREHRLKVIALADDLASH